MTLSYICNNDQINTIHAEDTSVGTYHFIQKKGEETYDSYRKVDMKGKEHFYVQVTLPKFLFESLILSGKIEKIIYKK